jgi:23S rRNA pseudouridine1911/1915/1917 synthase
LTDAKSIPIVYESEDCLVAIKPAGLVVIPERPTDGAFMHGVEPELPLVQILEATHGKLFVVHRIDRDTSGIVLFAKTKSAHAIYSQAFQEHRVEKVYHALVSGRPEWEATQCRLSLRVDADREHRTIVDRKRGKESITNLRVLRNFGSISLIEARPETGRTHQIRVHLSAMGFPILCDALYGSEKPLNLSDFKRNRRGDPFDEKPLLSRLALHALSLRLPAEEEGKPELFFEAPYPKDLRAALNQLEKTYPLKNAVDPLA